MSTNMTTAAPSVTAAVTPNRVGSGVVLMNPADQPASLLPSAFERTIAHVKDWRSPVLLIHGDDDRNVQFSQTVQLATALRTQSVDVEQLIFPDDIHDFLTHAHWVAAYEAAADFFQRRLGGGTSATSRR
ncbi:MAG: hypothetical protein DMD42_07095 [Gemmatimonadetes bacterium]|nr:MAG: hypothetical protein DMD42_07095 [Gemmatimonadota bacterium]